MNIIRSGVGVVLAVALLAVGCGGSGSAIAVVANAGDDQDVLTSSTVTLDGQGSVGVVTSTWTFTSRPTGSSATFSGSGTLTPTFVADVAGAYVIQLSVNGGAATDSVTVTAKSVIAAIGVGSGSNIATRERFNTTEYVIDLADTGGILDASGSRTGSGSIASYAWEQVAGPSATTTNGTTNSTLTFTAPTLANFPTLASSEAYKWQVLPVSRDDTKLMFKLTVTDSSGNTDAAVFIVYVADEGSEIHTSSGLPNVAVGSKVYLSGPSLRAAGANTTTALLGSAITDWSWTLSLPAGSSVTFADSGSTTSSIQFPSFTPDVDGIYTVTYTSTSGSVTSGELQINTADWAGVGTIGGTTPVSPQCANCHDGTVEGDMTTGWMATEHASIFEDSLTTYAGLAPEPYLWQFHTVGYNTDATNTGFDDLANTNDFTFPEEGMTFSELTTDYAAVAKLANVQCENCHGPGDQHRGDPLRIKFSASQFGVCGQCHIQEAQWINSAHNMTGVVHGSGTYQSTWTSNTGCIRCHSSAGFVTHIEGGTLAAITETGVFPGLTCAGCHDPHSATNARQLRQAGNVTMVVDGSTVNAGKAAVCYTCHDGFYEFDEDDCDSNADGVADAICETIDQAATQYVRQVHYNPQAPIFEGKGALADLDGDGDNDLTLDENSFHSGSSFTLAGVTGDTTLASDNNKCVTCHMAAGPASDEEGYQHVGGHSFKLRSDHSIGHLQGEETEDDAAATAGDIELVSACTTCHSDDALTDFNRLARADYDGDGDQEGIQDEVKGLLVALTTKIKSLDTANVKSTSGTVESSGTVTVDVLSYAGTCSSLTSTACKPASGTGTCSNVKAGYTRDDYTMCNFLDASATIRRAIWNHNLIARDGSLGVHNAAFMIQVLQQTYTAAGGNSFATDYPNATLR